MFELLLTSGARTVPIRVEAANLGWAARQIVDLIHRDRPVHVITDERVAFHYLSEFKVEITARFGAVTSSVLVPGEQNKTLHAASRILDDLAQIKFPRDGVIIGLGGGVATDVAGFVASLYHRGVDWIAVPTSLLGMVDAAIGGKTGVDHALGKNLIGSFHQPLAVLAPTELLRTLDVRQWRSGSAEVVKSAMLSGGELWELVSELGVDLSAWTSNQVERAIQLSAHAKVEIVNVDEHESGQRRLLNLGHTFGHAIEAVTGYTACTHGEAVFLGLRAMLKISKAVSRLDVGQADDIDNLLAKITLPALSINCQELMEALSRDKKIAQGKIHWVLLDTIGQGVVTSDVGEKVVEETAEWLCDIAAHGRFVAEDIRRKRILVVNGPNLNLLGIREPQIYGSQTFNDLEHFIGECAQNNHAELLCRQSNHEGEIVSHIQWAKHWADGIIINPGGFTHTSVAIRDAISAVAIPTIEVHLSDIHGREEFRKVSLMKDVCVATICGRGFQGYADAVEYLCRT